MHNDKINIVLNRTEKVCSFNSNFGDNTKHTYSCSRFSSPENVFLSIVSSLLLSIYLNDQIMCTIVFATVYSLINRSKLRILSMSRQNHFFKYHLQMLQFLQSGKSVWFNVLDDIILQMSKKITIISTVL